MTLSQSQQLIPPEDLVVLARDLDRNYHALIRSPEWIDGAKDWRGYIAPNIRQLWSRLPYTAQMTAFVVTASIVEQRRRIKSG